MPAPRFRVRPIPTSATRRRLSIVVLLAGTFGLGGCWTSGSAAPDRTRRPDDAAAVADALAGARWPERDLVALEAIRDATPPVVHTVRAGPEGNAQQSDTELLERLAPLDRVITVELGEHGLLRVYDESGDHVDEVFERFTVGFDTDADFLSSWWLDSIFGERALQFSQELDESVAATAASAGLAVATRRSDVRLREGVRLGLPPQRSTPARGLLIRLPALTGTRFEQQVVDRLAADGWAILNVRPYRWVLPSDRAFPIPDGADGPERAGRAAAAHLDQMFADAAYATQAALAYLARTRPDIPLHPRALIAFSSGSFSAPAVAAAMGEELDAAIIVGSGAGLPDLARRSGLTDSGLRFRMADGSGVPPSLQERVDRAFAEATTLAPEALAPVFRRVPVLQVHAVLDVIVPASSGERLHRLLGEPDCLRFLGGHRGLFYFMPGQADRIAEWLDAAVPHQPARHPAPAPAPDPDPDRQSHRRESNP